MMRCSQAEVWISTRIDGEPVPAPAAAALAAHFAECARCRGFLAREEERSARLALILEPREPGRAAAAILRAASAERAAATFAVLGGAPGSRPLAVSRAPRRLALAAAAVVLAACGLLSFRLAEKEAPVAPAVAGGPAARAGSRGRASSVPVRVIAEERGRVPVPGADGSPWAREIRRLRIFDPADESVPAAGPRRLPRVEVELNDTRYLRLVDYPYH